MKIPQKIRAFGFDYKISLKNKIKDKGKTWAGLINHKKLTIELDKSYNKQRVEKTFFHEITHLIACESGIKLNEHNVELLSSGFYNVLKDNKFLK